MNEPNLHLPVLYAVISADGAFDCCTYNEQFANRYANDIGGKVIPCPQFRNEERAALGRMMGWDKKTESEPYDG